MFSEKSSTNPWLVATFTLAGLIVGYLIGTANYSPTLTVQPAAPDTVVDVPAVPSYPAPTVDDDPVLGDPAAPVTLIEFSDFQCPFCRRFYEGALPQIKKNYIDTGKVKLVFRDFPLPFHPMAISAAQSANCAGEQGKYWEMHDQIFDQQAGESGTVQFTKDDLITWAQGVAGLDQTKWKTCFESDKYSTEINNDLADGNTAGVNGTPTVFINGTPLVGALPYAAFAQEIEAALAK